MADSLKSVNMDTQLRTAIWKRFVTEDGRVWYRATEYYEDVAYPRNRTGKE